MHSPSPWGRKQSISDRQVLSFPLGKEAIHHRQAVRQALSFPLGKGSSSSQATVHLPPGEGDSSSQAIAHLPPRKGSNSPLATAHLPTGEGSNSLLATAHLPPREGSCSSQATAYLSSGEAGSSSRQLLTFPLGKVTVLPSQPLILRQGKQAIKLGQTGRALGILPGIGHPRLPRRIALPPRQTALTPRKATPPLPSPVGFPKGLLMKNLTLSGSLTYPANL